MYIKRADIEKVKKIAKKYSNSHITVEALFYHIFTDSKCVTFISKSYPEVDFKMIAAELEDILDNEILKTEGEPIMSFEFEVLLKECLAISRLRGKKELCITEVFNALIGSEQSTIAELLEECGMPVSLNMFEQHQTSKQPEPSTKKSEAMDEIEFKRHTVLLNKNLPDNFTPSIGCEDYLSEFQRVLLRKEKNSIMITGEPGVGKTNIVHTLVNMIDNHQTNKNLSDVKIYSLNMVSLLSDIKFNGVLEARINSIINYLISKPNVVLFVDEIHTLAGNSAGGGEVLNFFKNPMANGQIKIIGATTMAEFNKYMAKNQAFVRRFSRITIEEPSPEMTIQIINDRISDYEDFYKIKVDKNIVEVLVKATTTYAKTKFNPDKSIDILDSMMARKVLNGGKKVTISDVYEEVSKEYRISSDELSKTSSDRLENLKATLNTRIVGQEKAFDSLINSLYVSMAGLRDPNKTMGNFLFQGTTSTGKTETAKIISESLGIPLLRYDMSAFKERHTVSTLIGSPPGYVGFNEGNGGGKLIADIEKHPHCVLLLDEIEKAHPDILTVLLQVMDYGRLTSSSGKDVYFNKVILIMTSNVGGQASVKPKIGFGNQDQSAEIINDAMADLFLPELRARIDNTIKFNRLTIDNVKQIVRNQIEKFAKDMAQHKINLTVEDGVIDRIAADSFKTNLGARNIQHIIAKDIQPKIARLILNEPKRSKQIKKSVVLKEGIIDVE